MRTLYFQTDTTGRYLFREPVTHEEQPHLMRLAWVIAEDDRIVHEWCRLVQPRNGWIIDDDAVTAHGITPEAAQAEGAPLDYVMSRFIAALDGVGRACAYNSDFHVKVLQRSAYECGLNWQHLFNEHTVACAMRRATDIVKKPRMAPGGGYSWAKLAEAYGFFTDKDLPPLDMDATERGCALARCVYAIDQGILATQREVPHE